MVLIRSELVFVQVCARSRLVAYAEKHSPYAEELRDVRSRAEPNYLCTSSLVWLTSTCQCEVEEIIYYSWTITLIQAFVRWIHTDSHIEYTFHCC